MTQSVGNEAEGASLKGNHRGWFMGLIPTHSLSIELASFWYRSDLKFDRLQQLGPISGVDLHFFP